MRPSLKNEFGLLNEAGITEGEQLHKITLTSQNEPGLTGHAWTNPIEGELFKFQNTMGQARYAP